MPIRKNPLVTDEIYHIFNRSIAGYQIFNSSKNYSRFMETLIYYTYAIQDCKYSEFKKTNIPISLQNISNVKLINIIAYCIMPTHFHLIVKQLSDNGISKAINLAQLSYSKYFNKINNRKGPLWESRFKNVRVENDDYLLHLTRYIHLNPVSSDIVSFPEEWEYSSYREYLNIEKIDKKVCVFSNLIEIIPESYKKFVIDRIDYQKKLEKIKHLLME